MKKTQKEKIQNENYELNKEIQSTYPPFLIDYDALRKAREEQCYSREYLALSAGISENTIENIEKGKNVEIETLKKYCKALGINLQKIIKLNKVETPNDEETSPFEIITINDDIYLPLPETEEEKEKREKYIKWVMENIACNHDPEKNIPEPPPTPQSRKRPTQQNDSMQ